MQVKRQREMYKQMYEQKDPELFSYSIMTFSADTILFFLSSIIFLLVLVTS